MGRTNSDATTVVPILRDDGTVYFDTRSGITERLCQWGVGFLWFLVVAVIVSTLLWI